MWALGNSSSSDWTRVIALKLQRSHPQRVKHKLSEILDMFSGEVQLLKQLVDLAVQNCDNSGCSEFDQTVDAQVQDIRNLIPAMKNEGFSDQRLLEVLIEKLGNEFVHQYFLEG